MSPGHGDCDTGVVYDDVEGIHRQAGAPSATYRARLIGVLRPTSRAVCFYDPHCGELFFLGAGRVSKNDLFAAIHAEDENVKTRFGLWHRALSWTNSGANSIASLCGILPPNSKSASSPAVQAAECLIQRLGIKAGLVSKQAKAVRRCITIPCRQMRHGGRKSLIRSRVRFRVREKG
jgi:hypothetical protein